MKTTQLATIILYSLMVASVFLTPKISLGQPYRIVDGRLAFASTADYQQLHNSLTHLSPQDLLNF